MLPKRITQAEWDQALDDALDRIYASQKEKYGSQKRRKARIKFVAVEEEQACVRWIYNQVPLMEELLGEPCEVDHIIPLAKGGEHGPNNLQIIPKRINRNKRDAKDFDYSSYRASCSGSRTENSQG